VITVRVDDRELRRALELLGGREARAAASRAVRRGAEGAQKEARAIAFEELNLPKSEINSLVKITSRPTTSRPEATVRITAKKVALADYLGERQTKSGVTVQVRRGGPRTLFRHAFIAEVGKGKHRGIFWRRKGTGPSGLVGRLPIDELFSNPLVTVLGKKAHMARILKVARERVVTTLKQEIRYRLAKRAGA